MRKGVRNLAGVVALVLPAGGVAVWATWPASAPPPDWSAEYDLSARPLDAIKSGTVVDRGPPAGWSHLVIKSLPRVREDNRPLLPAITVEKASWMFTAFVADVTKEEQGGHSRHRLRAVGMGLGAAVNGRDTIRVPEDLSRLDLNRQILVKGYEVQRKALLVVLGPSMGLVDTPVWFKCGGENKLVRYRYALLVDPPTGRLDVWLWSLGADGAACGELAEVVRIEPNTIDEAELVVEPKKVGPLGIPSDDAFAVEKFPPGRRSPLPPDLRSLAAKTRFAPAEAAELERRLRALPTADPTPEGVVMLTLALSLTLAAPAPAAADNPLYRSLLDPGLTVGPDRRVKLSPPAMADGLSADQQRAALAALIGKEYSYDEFTRKSVVAPFLLKIGDAPAADPKTPVRTVDVYFVTYGDLRATDDEKFLERLTKVGEGDGKGRSLTAEELKKRSITVKAGDEKREGWGQVEFDFLEKVRLKMTGHAAWHKAAESVVAAAEIDPRFRGDGEFPNEWRPIVKAGGESKIGPPQPYGGAGMYLKITKLAEPAGALFVEQHIAFAEPTGWFDGANLLRSKLPLVVQNNVRNMRKEWLKGAGK